MTVPAKTSSSESRQSAHPTDEFEVTAIGRSCVDIYPLQVGMGLDAVEPFGKYLGGSATNVAARLGC